MNSVLSINERPDPHCEESGPSNLVSLGTAPDVGQSLAHTPTSSNPPSRNQRRINVDRVSIRNSIVAHLISGSGHSGVVTRPCKAGDSVTTGQTWVRILLSMLFTNADSYSRCFRYLDCFDGGPARPCVGWHKTSEDIGGLPRVTFKAVYLSSQFDRLGGFCEI